MRTYAHYNRIAFINRILPLLAAGAMGLIVAGIGFGIVYAASEEVRIVEEARI